MDVTASRENGVDRDEEEESEAKLNDEIKERAAHRNERTGSEIGENRVCQLELDEEDERKESKSERESARASKRQRVEETPRVRITNTIVLVRDWRARNHDDDG